MGAPSRVQISDRLTVKMAVKAIRTEIYSSPIVPNIRGSKHVGDGTNLQMLWVKIKPNFSMGVSFLTTTKAKNVICNRPDKPCFSLANC